MSWEICLLHAVIGILSYVFLFMGSLGGVSYLIVFRLPKVKEVPEFLDVAQKVRLSFNLFYFLSSFVLLTLSLPLGLISSWRNWNVLAEPKLYSSILLWLVLFVGLLVILIKKRRKEDVGKIAAWASIVAFLFALFNLLVGNFIFGGNHQFL
jgi:hypothetical protein